jgi:hypothetical protein
MDRICEAPNTSLIPHDSSLEVGTALDASSFHTEYFTRPPPKATSGNLEREKRKRSRDTPKGPNQTGESLDPDGISPRQRLFLKSFCHRVKYSLLTDHSCQAFLLHSTTLGPGTAITFHLLILSECSRQYDVSFRPDSMLITC